MYTVVDIETTGNGIKGNKVTEISIFKYDGYAVVDEFTSLINPECEIPYFITGLTGIDNQMVRDAPTFETLAPTILEFTKDCIFVAHSVNFDYNVLKNEFKEIGLDFVRKKLCTVRLSRRLFPGYHSYSLGKLCTSLDIPLKDRHRARGDAQATVLLFQKLLRAPGAEKVFKMFLNARSQEATLPPSLPKDVFENLPTKPGIYYFKNARGKIIYVGKAINIKKRVLSHFYDKANKEVRMCRETNHIDFELSGSNLLALLMESAAIKKHYPEYNSSQKRNLRPYGIFCYEDRKGILHLAFNHLKMAPNALATFYSPTNCRLYLEELCKIFGLCPKYCHLQENVNTCNHYRIPTCGGVCRGTESIREYNEKVQRAIAHIRSKKTDFIIRQKGRTPTEDAFVLVRNDTYLGYGFIEKDVAINSFEDLETFLLPQKDTVEVQGILTSFLNKMGEKTLVESYLTESSPQT
ncbi:exonuclease domain-containing protein [Ulvibacterium sp.]|uniref:exonuclease domain-containing protein n=1 Tax=Ulvibacterium sp. TaxID=2665914 RepID=UPI0026342425|nr:exonuclease domain-containing protein [Ulvibacterium sp.]